MNVNRFLMCVMFTALLAAVTAQANDMGNICAKIAKEKSPVAYLIDEKGEVVNGPVSFGHYAATVDHVSDYEVAPTSYRLLVIPRNIVASSTECNMCINLKKIAGVCHNASTYEIGVGMSFRGEAGIRPYKVEADFIVQFEDPLEAYPIDVKLNFTPKITGELYDPTQKNNPI